MPISCWPGRRGSADAVKQSSTEAATDPTDILSYQSRLAYYLRAGQDEAARRTLVRLDADPRFTGQRFRAVVEGALTQGGPDAVSKCLLWLAPHFKREPRSAVWAGRLLEGSGKVADALCLYKSATEAYPAFADGWSARLLVSARLGGAEVSETMTLAAGPRPAGVLRGSRRVRAGSGEARRLVPACGLGRGSAAYERHVSPPAKPGPGWKTPSPF